MNTPARGCGGVFHHCFIGLISSSSSLQQDSDLYGLQNQGGKNIKFSFCSGRHLVNSKAKGNGTEKCFKGENVHINIGEI